MQQKNFTLEIAGRSFNTWYIRDGSTAVEAIRVLREKGRSPLALDVETYAKPAYVGNPSAALDPLQSLPRLIQVSDGVNIVVLDLLHIGEVSFLRSFLTESRFIAHNALFEIQHLLCNLGVSNPDVGCTRIATRLMYDAIYPFSAGYYADLGTVVKELLKVEIPKDIDHKCWGFPELTYEQICYAATDVAVMHPIAEKLTSGLQKFGLLKIYDLYKRSQVPLARMQLNGIQMNEPLHRELIAQWKVDAHIARLDLLKLTGLKDTNPKSIISYLEETLPPEVLAIWPLTDGGESGEGELSLSADTFSDFSFIPIVEPFSRFQKAVKLSSTYGTKLLNKVNKADNRIHCSYNICGTRTGRLSASNPNLQQLPRGRDTRSMFMAPAGRKFVVADFNQIELRVAAEVSRDPEMLRAYRNGMDLHVVTAQMLSGIQLINMMEDEAKKARQSAKALNFGLLFGLGKKKFKHYAHKNYGAEMTEDQAYEAVSAWRDLYSGYSEWHKEISQQCAVTLKVRTATGKLRALSEENYYGASANTPVQGSASEAMLSSIIRIDSNLRSSDHLLNTVHDEIMIEINDNPEDEARVKQLMIEEMTNGFKDIFPNGVITDKLVEVKSGFNWAQCK